jgi:hypothetical protein
MKNEDSNVSALPERVNEGTDFSISFEEVDHKIRSLKSLMKK